MAEKGERDMEVLARDRAHPPRREVVPLPGLEEVERGPGQAQREKEPEAFIATDASARGHTASS